MEEHFWLTLTMPGLFSDCVWRSDIHATRLSLQRRQAINNALGVFEFEFTECKGCPDCKGIVNAGV